MLQKNKIAESLKFPKAYQLSICYIKKVKWFCSPVHLNWPVGDERIVPGVSVSSRQREQKLSFLCVFQQDGADVVAGTENGVVVVQVS